MGGRCVIVPHTLTRTIHAATQTFSPDGTPSNGVFVWCDLDQTEQVKNRLEQKLFETGLLPFWKVTSYKDFERSTLFNG